MLNAEVVAPYRNQLSPEQQAELLRLFDEEGLTASAISRKTHINIGSVAWLLKKNLRSKPAIEQTSLNHEELVAAREVEKERQAAAQTAKEKRFGSIALRLLAKVERVLLNPSGKGFNPSSALEFAKAADITLERHRRVLGLPDPPKARMKRE